MLAAHAFCSLNQQDDWSYLAHMSDIRELFSPDRRFFVVLSSYEVRMSHWITGAALWESAPRRKLLEFGNAWWSTEQATWQPDGANLSVELRRYPGDAPSLLLDIDAARRIITPHTPAGAAPFGFDALDPYLEEYYRQHRRA
ncbi:MAG TPA: hypothetical protein VFT99_14235 [Roseiflexaceae bacterium]|nr:hypothetical protein [Roseiflexaceae bacterium]